MPTLSIPRDYADLSVLTKAQLDTAFTAVETAANTSKWGSDNLAANSVTSDQIAAQNVTLAKLATAVANALVPAGAVLAFGGTSAPTGYLMCDGSAVSRTTYADLFAAIGTAHGNGDGSSSFNLPDYRGRFLRGVDGSAGNDPDKASRTAMASGGNTGNNVGSVQSDATKKNGLALSDSGHSHIQTAMNPPSGVGSSTVAATATANPPTPGNLGHNTASATTGVTLGNGDNETRPLNAFCHFIIKT